MPQKRKAPGKSSSRPAQQTKLDHFVVQRERCPHCPEAFSSVAELIQHVEAAHLADGQQHSASSSPPDVAQTQPQHAEPPQAAPHAQPAWWQQPPADPVVAHIRFARGSGPNTQQPLQPVRLSALSSVAPVELVRDALPAALASSLLAELLAQSGGWVAGSWWFGGQLQTAPRSSATYCLVGQQETPPAAESPSPPSQQQQQQTAHAVSTPAASLLPDSPPSGAAGLAAAAADLASVPKLPAPPVLQQAAELVATAVSNRMQSSQHMQWQQHRQALTAALLSGAAAASTGQNTAAALSTSPAPPAAAADPQQPEQQQQQQQQQWQPSYVLANLYKDGQQSVGSHADRLSSLGPLPTIASLSLGAGRVFRLHPAHPTVAAAAAAAAAAAVATGHGGNGRAAVSSVDIHLPHNSLLIMWPPTQEQWKHEVPKAKTVTHHHLSGTARINLTFRQLHQAWAAAVPHCRCGRPAIMRCSTTAASGLQGGRSSDAAAGSSAAAAVVGGGGGGPGALQGGGLVYYYACDNTQGPGCGLYKPAVSLRAGG